MNEDAEKITLLDVADKLDVLSQGGSLDDPPMSAITVLKKAATFVRDSYHALSRIREAPKNNNHLTIWMQQVAAHALDPEKLPAPLTWFEMSAHTTAEMEAIPLLLNCPACGARHIDEGDFASKRHHTHACQQCGMVWRPAIVATVGVKFLPGFKNPDNINVDYKVTVVNRYEMR